MLQHLGSAAATLVAPWFDLLDQRSFVSYAAALWFTLGFTVLLRLRQRRRFALRAFSRFVVRKSLWRHRSSMLDYKLYALNMAFTGFLMAFFVVAITVWADIVRGSLTHLLGPAAAAPASWPVTLLITVALVVAMDFGYWFCHRLLHKSACLWEFHKVHHSAEVMTLATEYREHPVESALISNTQSVTVGLTLGVLGYAFGTEATTAANAWYAAAIFAHLVTFHHLRHSHINMPFTGALGRLLHSPGHHIIHHSADPAHYDSNMGYILSVWEWMAGTLILPKPGQRIELGLLEETAAFDTLASALWVPFRNAWAILVAGRSGAKRAVTSNL